MTLGLTLFLGWLCLSWLHCLRPDAALKTKWLVLLIVLPLTIYPFVYGSVWWLRGLTGDLSIISTVWLGLAMYHIMTSQCLFAQGERKLLTWAVAGVGLVFYPLTLGMGNMDPYVWGYANGYMLAAVLGLSLFAFVRGYVVLASMLMLSVLAWIMGLLQSNNLWDYLLDPFIFFLALARCLRCKA
ncbi:MAG: hypothetical protein Q9N67_11675 [Ghiorsea sp.]|nr:hypothetical protein [Ghiorsea sp.]